MNTTENMNFSASIKQITLDNKHLSYLDIGTGPVLLFGHCYLWDSKMWKPQIEHLSSQYRCIVPDLWGHGESGTLPESTHSLRDISQQMLQLMDNLSIDKFSVIGLSVGGMWGAELALIAPTRVKALVMMNCFIGYEPEVARAQYYSMLDIIKENQAIPLSVIEQIAPLYFSRNVQQDNPDLFNTFKYSLSNIEPERIESICRLGKIIFGRRDTMDDIDKWITPCLIMTGIEDTVRPVLESYLMHDAIDGSEFITIPRAGHISNLEQPDFVNAELERFLAKHLK